MAVYDIDADAATAVTAFLGQFKVAANGAVTFISGTDTFHTWWLHRALQKIAWDFAISGDDEINLSKPNPSTSEALGTIITLLDHTTAYGVNYTIDATVTTYLFGGSVTWDNGDEQVGGLIVLGSVNSAGTELQIIQDNVLLTSHWSTGKNQTDSQTLLRICVLARTLGADIDVQKVTVKANEWGDTYANWTTGLGLGEKVAAINTFSDPQNDTALVTVQAYVGIANTEGYQTIDIGDGSGLLPYHSQWTYAGNNKKALYEWVKSLMVRGTSDLIYGIDGDLLLGDATFEADVDTTGGGTWVQNEVVTWTEATVVSSGILMAADDMSDASTTQIWVHLLTGINPTDGTVISGATASNAINITVTSLIPSTNHLGVFTGSAWIGHYGSGFVSGELTSADSVTPLNGTPIQPPNNVPISVTVNGAINAHVILGIKDVGTGGIDQTQYTAAAGNDIGDPDFVIAEGIASDTPPAGWILVLEGTTWEALEYTSWTGSTFTINGTLPVSYTAAKNVIVPIFYDDAVSDGGTVATSLIYATDIDVVGWVRHGDPASPDKPVNIAGTIGTAGLSLTVQLEDE